jgi:hypothetical protein
MGRRYKGGVRYMGDREAVTASEAMSIEMLRACGCTIYRRFGDILLAEKQAFAGYQRGEDA